MTEIIKIRAHHLEEIAANIKARERGFSDDVHYTLKRLRELPDTQLIITDTYDDFCTKICEFGCNEIEVNARVWDRAFVNYYNFPTNVPISSEKFIARMEEVAQKRNRFATSDPVMGEGEGLVMSYEEIDSYLSTFYFN